MSSEALRLTAQVVTSHASATELKPEELLDEIKEIYYLLVSLENAEEAPGTLLTMGRTSGAAKAPPIPLKDIVRENYVVCLECEKKFRTLRGHLKKAHNLTPKEYLALYGLDRTKFPLVCQEYSAIRRQLALDKGLGLKDSPRRIAQSA